jgi:hypothetical protein
MSKLNATGANPTIPPMTARNRDKQWGTGSNSDHSVDYPGVLKHQYASQALILARSAVDGNILGYKGEDGSIVRFNKATGDWVKAYETGVATMFKPKNGEAYYYENMIEDGGVIND